MSLRWSRLSFPIAVLALLAFAPFVYSLVVGQMSPVTLLLFSLIAGLEWQKRGGFLPGILAGLALYKPQLLLPLLIYWLFMRRWRTLAGFFGTGLLILIASILVNWSATVAFFHTILEYFQLSTSANESGANASFFAISPWLWGVIALAVLFTLLLSSRQSENRYAYAMLWLSPVLVTPYVVTYDLLLLFLPLTFLIPYLSHDRYLQVGAVLLYLTPLVAIPLLSVKPVIITALGLFFISAWRFWHPSQRDEGGGTASKNI